MQKPYITREMWNYIWMGQRGGLYCTFNYISFLWHIPKFIYHLSSIHMFISHPSWVFSYLSLRVPILYYTFYLFINLSGPYHLFQYLSISSTPLPIPLTYSVTPPSVAILLHIHYSLPHHLFPYLFFNFSTPTYPLNLPSLTITLPTYPSVPHHLLHSSIPRFLSFLSIPLPIHH